MAVVPLRTIRGPRGGTALVRTVTIVWAAVSGLLVPRYRLGGVGLAGAGIVVALVALDPAGVAVAAVPSVLLTRRTLAGSISLSDLVAIIAAFTALMAHVPRQLPRQSRLLFASLGVYLLSLSVSLLANHHVRGGFEWFHRLELVGGSVCIGAWLVMRGLHTLALRLLLVATIVVAVGAVIYTFSHGLLPAYPFGYQKNFAGSILATTIVVALAAPEAFKLPIFVRFAAIFTLTSGMIATQSRGSVLEVVAGGLIWFLRSHPARRRRISGLVFLVGAGLSYYIYASVQQQYAAQHNGVTINSLTQRSVVEKQTRQLFVHHPISGVGLRYYDTPQFSSYQAPNDVIDEVLAEAGIPGLFGFIVLIGGSAVALRRCPGDLATAGLAVVVGHVIHGAVDIYWVAGTTSLPWIIAGMGLGSVAVSETNVAARSLGQLPSNDAAEELVPA